MLKIKNIASGYGETEILHDLSLEVGKGEVAAFMGRNGVGKTTLLKTIMGIIRPSRGNIFFKEQDITDWYPERRARAGLAYIPQGRDIFPFLSVRENLVLGLEARGKTEKEIPEDIYILFPELKKLENRKGGDLSGGQQQQLAIARMMILEPELILFDEPTEGIQPSIVKSIEHAIRVVKERRKVTVILVEQFVDFAFRLADVCYVFEKGAVVYRENVSSMNKNEISKYISL